jgi:hypothetical protein
MAVDFFSHGAVQLLHRLHESHRKDLVLVLRGELEGVAKFAHLRKGDVGPCSAPVPFFFEACALHKTAQGVGVLKFVKSKSAFLPVKTESGW